MNNMPPITKNLLIINILVFATQYVMEARFGINLDDYLGLHFLLASNFHAYQLFTYMFMHGGWEHLFFNMFAVWMFGRIMEQTMGPKRFLFYYLTCGLGAGLMQELVQYISYVYQGLNAYEQIISNGGIMEMSDYLNRWTTVGASGAVYGILLSFGMTFPEERMFIFPLPVPIKAKYFVMGYAVIELLSALGRSGDGIAHFAHLGGMLVGFLLLLYWRSGGSNGHRGGNYYGRNYTYRQSNWDKFRNWFASMKKKMQKPHITVTQGGKFAQDMQYNQERKAEETNIDTILDKVKKHGYAALTETEKKQLFDFSNKQ